MTGAELATIAERSAVLALQAADLSNRVRNDKQTWQWSDLFVGLGRRVWRFFDKDYSDPQALAELSVDLGNLATEARAFGSAEAPAELVARYDELAGGFRVAQEKLAAESNAEVATWNDSGMGAILDFAHDAPPAALKAAGDFWDRNTGRLIMAAVVVAALVGAWLLLGFLKEVRR